MLWISKSIPRYSVRFNYLFIFTYFLLAPLYTSISPSLPACQWRAVNLVLLIDLPLCALINYVEYWMLIGGLLLQSNGVIIWPVPFIIINRDCCFVINSLWPSDTIWWHRSGSTLAQVMACCLMALSMLSHYLNQYWLIIHKVYWHSSEGNFIRDTSATIH